MTTDLKQPIERTRCRFQDIIEERADDLVRGPKFTGALCSVATAYS
jgi:hypothetical protein